MIPTEQRWTCSHRRSIFTFPLSFKAVRISTRLERVFCDLGRRATRAACVGLDEAFNVPLYRCVRDTLPVLLLYKVGDFRGQSILIEYQTRVVAECPIPSRGALEVGNDVPVKQPERRRGLQI